ncbi:MAG: hypothetical protein A3G02_01130 [Candidatus Yanofskybacteria bacterium RIFCSPLOWO2_12_FULL_44_13b]|uniref:Glycosyltransferase RgtA/B/C/D-like domain-containing protein n=2 Tax=Parcubacteria group TaxID=1794811 RepID=A0A1F8H292_9BACT|nr:MAG: hypothetical protein UU38_C0004G0054 [Candidatus Wolfebacteria bacterium GW2011_GWB1_41_12]KKT28944.1 MAG: hypothetical protein UW14_C0001G0055 [Candidatus Yanofskybacteria bacterium GW2011_GWA2_44_10]OGN03482.1 MAG: hypothetical protein A2657_02250 [Candidatus Yanofskybacteria bacterium RIFCSPHIGHO2_01_FULL_44_110b]OGN14172.1 MAG: hypothetical protein A3C01_01075 [Candidatus Yanofskybacteria bacterium RIFCSPHIGHO2_02_FULL_44_36b]OGN19224.1 MAG: hypothetical protein A3F50_02925 [Candida
MNLDKKEIRLLIAVILAMLVYFLIAAPVMMDDGFHYEGFAEALAGGKLDFKSFYGFQGLSFFAVPIYWLTGSHNSIIIASMIFSLLSIPLAYAVGRDYFQSRRAGMYFLILFLLAPYPYTTMMRGFQEAALLFFILLIIYGSISEKKWTPLAWSIGGIVKPFALVLAPLFLKESIKTFTSKSKIWVFAALAFGGLYLGANYYQTGHFVNNAAINSYQGNFDPSNTPALAESFVPSIKGFLRVGANLLLHFRKIMISPLVIILGAFALLLDKSLKVRKEIIWAVVLNFVLVGSLTFSFSKYLLPMTTLFALVSIGYLLKHRWLMILVFVDSFFVFLPIWNYFGHNYWINLWLYLIPFWAALILFIIYEYGYLFQNNHRYPDA